MRVCVCIYVYTEYSSITNLDTVKSAYNEFGYNEVRDIVKA